MKQNFLARYGDVISRRHLVVGLLFFLLGWMGTIPAQRPEFRKWNLGMVEGLSDLNAISGLPTLSGHYRNISAEVSPYPFSLGLGATYHFPVLKMFKKLNFTFDGTAFFARQNANWYATFPRFIRMYNFARTGVMAGTSFYFLGRFCFQLAIGMQYVALYGPPELIPYRGAHNYFIETGSVSLRFRLFRNFQ